MTTKDFAKEKSKTVHHKPRERVTKTRCWVYLSAFLLFLRQDAQVCMGEVSNVTFYILLQSTNVHLLVSLEMLVFPQFFIRKQMPNFLASKDQNQLDGAFDMEHFSHQMAGVNSNASNEFFT